MAEQAQIDAYFGRDAEYWDYVYGQHDVDGLVYRQRMETVLRWIDALGLPPGSRVLDVGCGAGLVTVELARRGFAVEAVDSSSEMVAQASRRVADAGLVDTAAVSTSDAQALPQAAGSFSLVVALGVLPWVPSPGRALWEWARVLAPGGHLIVTADNRVRLNLLVEPSENPLLSPLVAARRSVRRRRGWRPPTVVAQRHRPKRVDQALEANGLVVERRATVGFGPFTFRRRAVLGNDAGRRLHSRLQRLADRGVTGVHLCGWHYVASARRI